MEFRADKTLMILALAGILAGGWAGAAAAGAKEQPSNRLAEAHAHYSAAVVHALSDQPDLSLEEFHKAALLDPDNESLTLEVSRRFMERQKLNEALELLKRSAARPEASGAVFSRLGFIHAQMGKLDEAMAANRQAIKKSPADFAGHQLLHAALLQKNQRAEAFKVLERATGVADADAEFLVSLAELLVNHSRRFPGEKAAANKAALKVLNRAVALKPASITLRFRLADAFSFAGDPPEAARIYGALLPETSDDTVMRGNIRARLVDLYLRTGERTLAIKQLEAIVQDDPANVGASYQLGNLAEDGQNYALAVESLHRVVLLRPEFEPPYYDLAQAQIGLNQPGEALATLVRAREKFRASFVGEFLSGLASGQLQKFDDALAHLTSAEMLARASDPKRLNEGFYYQLGSVYERKGDFLQAENFLRKSLELAPNFAMAQNYLGYMWADRGTNLDEARKLIEQAVQAEPKSFAYLDSLAWVLFKLKQPEAALPPLLKAIELSSQPDATLYDHLGDIYAELHQPGKAREAWQKSLKIEPNKAIRRKLDSTPAP